MIKQGSEILKASEGFEWTSNNIEQPVDIFRTLRRWYLKASIFYTLCSMGSEYITKSNLYRCSNILHLSLKQYEKLNPNERKEMCV